jgi:hypothetical protein
MIRQPDQDETPLSPAEQEIAEQLGIKPKRTNKKRFWWRDEQQQQKEAA